MVDVAREMAEIKATLRRAQRRARVEGLRARAMSAGRTVPPRKVRRQFSVARINAALARATSIRDAARRLGCAHTTISRHASPAVQEALRRRGLRWTPAKLLLGVDRDIVLARSRGWSARRIASALSLDVRDVRKVLREAGMGTPRRGPARPKRCPGLRMDVVTRREEPCDRMLPPGKAKRCPECREYARKRRAVRLRVARWQAQNAAGEGRLSRSERAKGWCVQCDGNARGARDSAQETGERARTDHDRGRDSRTHKPVPERKRLLTVKRWQAGNPAS